MDDEGFARLDARLDRVEAALDRVVEMLGRSTGSSASSALGDGSVGVRLAAVEASLSTLMQPSNLNGLTRLGELAPMVSDTVAMTTDIADEWIADNLGGDEFDARLKAGLQALLALSKPSVLQAVSVFAEQAPQLQTAVGLAASLDDTVAMAADIADEWVRETVGGDGLDERMHAAGQALRTVSDPQIVEALGALASLAPRLLKSATVAAELDDLVASVGEAMREPAQRVGPFGLLKALRDPDIQRGLGQALLVARRLGQSSSLLPVQHRSSGV
jgi:hypothetical protein